MPARQRVPGGRDRRPARRRAGAGRRAPRGRAAHAAGRRRSRRGALAAASLAAFGAEAGPRLPVVALAQARMLSDLSVASGAETARPGAETAARDVGVPLAAAIGTGLAGRELVRRLPVRVRSLDALVAAGATLALGTVFRRMARS